MVDIHFSGVYLQNSFPRFFIRMGQLDFSVQAPGAKQRRIQHVGSVRGRNHLPHTHTPREEEEERHRHIERRWRHPTEPGRNRYGQTPHGMTRSHRQTDYQYYIRTDIGEEEPSPTGRKKFMCGSCPPHTCLESESRLWGSRVSFTILPRPHFRNRSLAFSLGGKRKMREGENDGEEEEEGAGGGD